MGVKAGDWRWNAGGRTVDTQNNTNWAGRPEPPRGSRYTPGSMEAAIFWNMPADIRGADGFRIYRPDDNTVLFETMNPATRTAIIKLPASAKSLVYISCVSKAGRESPRIPLYVESNSDKYVADGTVGATAGTTAAPPPEWSSEDPYTSSLYGQPIPYLPPWIPTP